MATPYKELRRVSYVTIAANILLAAAKLVAGILYRSAAVISDAVHTLSDIITTVIVIIGLKIAHAPADKNHNYGHEKIEAVFSTLLAGMLFATGIIIALDAIGNLINGESPAIMSPLLLIVTGASILAKELMYQYTMHYAKKHNSSSLKADAWHHRSDSLSSIGVLVGLGIAYIFPSAAFAEQIAAIIVAALIVKVSIEIYLNSIDKLIDKAADYETVKKISEAVCRIPGVSRIDSLKTRLSTYKIYVDIEIAVSGTLSLAQAHEIAQQVHDELELKYTEFNIKHINVHVNPVE
jgi:cation diffusion facilitator family transporter